MYAKNGKKLIRDSKIRKSYSGSTPSGVHLLRTLTIYNDNKLELFMARNLVMWTKTRHREVDFHFV